ncbi:bis(5'-nucleosyl)-tetraphosphatase [Pediococcus claussenii]|uniref:Bis(5'-nucleosyl)-tetraphosphatase [asymmetrical] n=1 Tax=Pediococcus claussenii (strain ATCC BAA-344 / DSM 14800 / JCM 18046 / KCTC 3811 / LMG 21948 / P06) TaxID=701521 RepID=G8PF00_PEDCP|nr:NUDIX domain-containing protein [Pediococcus claussenii]AEV95679.1 NUDIX domain protein [Pediococcus claussenii ATCC BAA-344]ANZ69191.1 hypothetical protein AYR57_02245 [Pediococcus claussenii]ANZ71008.1 hypothetical protein AYR58_02245 [Pediococcus claussenii]
MNNESGAIIFQMRNDQPYFLLLQDAKTGFWRFSYGRNHSEESFIESANRSIMEETNLRVNVDSTFVNVLSIDDTQITLFIAEVKPDVHVRLDDEKISGMGWFDYVTAKQYLSLISQKEALNQVLVFVEKS